jgi:beta-lactam-binding protein with PASTA domain
VTVPDFTGKTVRAASVASARLGLELALQGSGVARSQAPAAGTHVAAGSTVTVQFTP